MSHHRSTEKKPEPPSNLNAIWKCEECETGYRYKHFPCQQCAIKDGHGLAPEQHAAVTFANNDNRRSRVTFRFVL